VIIRNASGFATEDAVLSSRRPDCESNGVPDRPAAFLVRPTVEHWQVGWCLLK
jgi:hypothetical protein